MTQPDPNAQSGAGGSQSGTDTGTSTSTDPANQTGAQSGAGTDANAGTAGQTSASGMTLEQALAELEQQRRRTQAADQTSARTAAELKKLQDAQLSEQERIANENKELKQQNAELVEAQKSCDIKLAFMEDTTYKWKNPSSALRLLDMEGVTVDDSGKVTGLKPALDKLAKSDAYLLETTETESTSTTGQAAAGSTGIPGNNGSTNAGVSKTEQARRFPALRTRGIQ